MTKTKLILRNSYFGQAHIVAVSLRVNLLKSCNNRALTIYINRNNNLTVNIYIPRNMSLPVYRFNNSVHITYRLASFSTSPIFNNHNRTVQQDSVLEEKV